MNIHNVSHLFIKKVYTNLVISGIFLAWISSANAQPSSFVKGVYVSVTAEPTFVLYGDTSISTIDALKNLCNMSYVDGICFKILWKDLTIDSSHGIMSISLYKQNLNELLQVVTYHHKGVALALYAGAFTPPSIISSMPANHVLKNIHLAPQSGGPCHIDSLVTTNKSSSTYNIPVPWDAAYQANFQNVMRILNRYLVQNNIALSYIIFTGINEFSAETRLPNDIIQTRDSHGNINFFQNDYVLWSNAGYHGYTVDPQINEARNTFNLFLNSIYNKYTTFRNAVLCVQGMGATAEFPQLPPRDPQAPYDNPNSIKYYACSENYDPNSDVFYDMLQDAMNSRRPMNSVASMYCSLSEEYTNALDYAGIINNSKGNNTGLCSSFKAYHLRDVEFITGTAAPANVNKTFVDDFTQALTNGVNAGAQFIEVFPYDIYAAQRATNTNLKNRLVQALSLTQLQLTTLSPDYDGKPASATISDTLTTGIKDSIRFSIPSLPAVMSYSWSVDGIVKGSGSSLSNFGVLKNVVAHGVHTISVNYSTNCGTSTASLSYKNGVPVPAAMQREIPSNGNDFTVRQLTPRHFTISFDYPVENARICVFNIAGQQVLSATTSGSQFNFNLNSVAAGLYLVKVLAPENQISGTVKISIPQ